MRQPTAKLTLTLTDQLRRAVLKDAGQCPECGHLARSGRELATRLGVHYTTLWRFTSGKTPSAALVDTLYHHYFGFRKRPRRG